MHSPHTLTAALGLFGVVLLPLYAPQGRGRRLSEVLPPGRDVAEFQVTPGGQRALYRADADHDGVFELYVTSTAGLETPVRLHSPLPPGRSVVDFVLEPSGTFAVFRADRDTDDMLEIFRVPVDGSAPPVQLNGPLEPQGDVRSVAVFGAPLYQVSPDGARVVYVADQDLDERCELYSVPIDGSTGPVKLNGPFGPIGDKDVSDECLFRITADSARVVYLADQDTDEVFELYSVPSDGSAAAVRLNAPLVAGGDVVSGEFDIDAGASRVVYLADQETDRVNELYSAPLDASAAPVKLNAALVAGGEVLRGFELSADGSRAVYRADQDVDGAVQLYSAPTDGSQAPVLVGGSALLGRTVQHFSLSPSDNRVAYAADQDSTGVFELYCGALDGSGLPIALCRAFQPYADVASEIRFTPDGTFVLFVADARVNQRFDLYAVPADGSAPPQRIHPARSHADVRAFQLGADGASVVYLADLDTDEVFELYHTPIQGGPTRKLCVNLVDGQEVLSRFDVRAEGVFYLADQRTDDVFELFRGGVLPEHSRRESPATMRRVQH